MAFEAELRASIKDLQSTAEGLAQQVEKSNQSLRDMQKEVHGVTAVHREAAEAAGEHARASEGLGHNIRGVSDGIRLMGGEAREAGHLLNGLFEFNPLALAAGAAVGFLVDKVHALVSEAIQGKAAVQDMGKSVQEMGHSLDDIQSKALQKIDAGAQRRTAFDRFFGDKDLQGIPADLRNLVNEGAFDAVESGRARNREEAIERIKKSGLLFQGQGGAFGQRTQRTRSQFGAAAAGVDDAEAFEDALNRARGTEEFSIATQADTAKFVAGAREQQSLARQAQASTDPHIQSLIVAIDRLTQQLANAKENSWTGRSGDIIRIENQLQETRQQYDAAVAQLTASTR